MTLYDVATAREAAPAIEAWLAYQRRYLRTPGVQAAIRVQDEVISSRAYGFADEPAGTELSTDHLFRIASHSKTFTATAVLQLAEQGKLRLDDPIGDHVPELAETGVGAVTLRELLGHQGGVIRDGVDTDFWQLIRPFPDRAELIELCRDHGVVYDRNEHFKYTNVGYSLLGLAIEHASGTGYHDYVRSMIIEPLGLAATGPEWSPEVSDQFAAGHTGLIDGAEPREAIGHIDTRGMAAATGFYSTAEDLVRYAAAHFHGNEDLITDASKRLIQRNESTVVAHGSELGTYGLGMDVTTIGDRRLVGHSGGYPGHITRTYLDPVDRIAVSVLTNCIGGPATTLANGVIKLLDLAAGDHEPDPAAADHDLSRFTGQFANLMGVVQIALLGGRLVGFFAAAPDPTESYDELLVVDENTLRGRPEAGFGFAGETVQFTWAADGSVESLRYGGGTRWPVPDFLARRSAQIKAAG
ncbi:serine hydrolase domain-containing protein [Microlunatus speluncae]|uniref:serine hydrolase domain-containing protein n=1 Tax=Microlunatus speluncae TaxID=2594267 RepID=UPI0012662460|nr:serine hydrolase domain-containing protein [Microlunatus speluncae]